MSWAFHILCSIYLLHYILKDFKAERIDPNTQFLRIMFLMVVMMAFGAITTFDSFLPLIDPKFF